MKRTLKIATTLTLVAILLVTLAACGSSSSKLENKILGSWFPADDDEGYFTFYSSGTLTATVMYEETKTGTWEITDNNTLEMTLYGDTVTVEVTRISSDSMTWLMNGKEVELLKKD